MQSDRSNRGKLITTGKKPISAEKGRIFAWLRLQAEATLSREGRMVDGAMVPVIAVAALAAMWDIVLWGSSFFGPR